MVKKYIIFQPPDNRELQSAIASWISEAGGKLSLKEIEEKSNERFHFFYFQVYTEDDMEDASPISSWKKFSFLVDDWVVYKKD